ncbi:hypothetical protein OG879_11555 [Streptomyces caniferus]|uniref:Uncharacterized protein n=1 Tax=Streptomyces caniferus TaxID=285557 RepID=A0A640SEE6_9ACTN|nr:hypothetical protein [Streptomyces caniferus]GFE09649.1 hypothetical protein Scani_59170 [Streptomyces caniferus]
MAIPKKDSRPLTVDGVAYRWSIRRKPTYAQGTCRGTLSIAAQLAHAPGSVAVLRTPHPHPANWLGAPAPTVRPAAVAHAIRSALHRGWQPNEPGRPFLLDLPPTA